MLGNARTPLTVGITLVVAVPATVLVTHAVGRRRPRAISPLHRPCVPASSPSPVPPEHPHALT